MPIKAKISGIAYLNLCAKYASDIKPMLDLIGIDTEKYAANAELPLLTREEVNVLSTFIQQNNKVDSRFEGSLSALKTKFPISTLEASLAKLQMLNILELTGDDQLRLVFLDEKKQSELNTSIPPAPPSSPTLKRKRRPQDLGQEDNKIPKVTLPPQTALSILREPATPPANSDSLHLEFQFIEITNSAIALLASESLQSHRRILDLENQLAEEKRQRAQEQESLLNKITVLQLTLHLEIALKNHFVGLASQHPFFQAARPQGILPQPTFTHPAPNTAALSQNALLHPFFHQQGPNFSLEQGSIEARILALYPSSQQGPR